MYTLYIANKNYSSWSLRPWVLMQELGIPFKEELVPFDGAVNFDKFKKFAPNAKVPCLYDDGHVVWESLAICEYLAESYNAVWPQEKSARSWARSAAAEMHADFSSLRNVCGMSIGVRIDLHEIEQGLQKDIDRLNELWAEGLTKFKGPFLAGPEFTAVDAFFAPVAFRCQTFSLPLIKEAQDYCDLLLSLPAMKEWQAEALLETTRDMDHENEIGSYGRVTEDFRQS